MVLPKEIANLDRSLKGAYILEFRLRSPVGIKVGKLGLFHLKKGWYYYTGSAMNGLRGRIARYIRGSDKRHWHIDYLTEKIKPVRLWFVVSTVKIESDVVRVVGKHAEPSIKGFGCGDSPGEYTHLFRSGKRINFMAGLRSIGPTTEVEIN